MDPVVTNIPPSRSCPQDATEDGLVDLTDLFFFLNEWFIGCP